MGKGKDKSHAQRWEIMRISQIVTSSWARSLIPTKIFDKLDKYWTLRLLAVKKSQKKINIYFLTIQTYKLKMSHKPSPPQNITTHLKAIYKEGELEASATCKEYLQVQQEGSHKVSRARSRKHNRNHLLMMPNWNATWRRKNELIRIMATMLAITVFAFKTNKRYDHYNKQLTRSGTMN